MINPFNSNQNQNYLFRKNYQLLSKPDPAPPQSTTHRSAPKVDIGSLKNPFLSPTPVALQPTYNQQPAINQSRSLSSSRAGFSSNFGNHNGFHTNRLSGADAWKKELEDEERKRVAVYGSEGLRYNAYSSYGNGYQQFRRSQASDSGVRKTAAFANNDYYMSVGAVESQARRRKVDPERTDQYGMDYSKTSTYKNVQSRHHTQSSNNSNSLSRNAPKLAKEPMSFRNRENFIDEINEEEVEQKVAKRINIQRHESVDLGEPANADASGMRDMFSSAGYDTVNRDMQHNSFIYTADMMVQSRPKPNQTHQKISRFPSQTSSNRRKVSIESDYDLGRSIREFPQTLKVAGLIYFKVQLQ